MMGKQDLSNWQQMVDLDEALSPDTNVTSRRSNRSLSDLWSPEEEMMPLRAHRDLGEALLESGVIDPAQLDEARKIAAATPGKDLGQIFADMQVNEASIQSHQAQIVGMSFETIDPAMIELKYLTKLGFDYCTRHGVIPLNTSGSRLLLGVTRPDDLIIIEEVRHRLGVSIKPVVVCASYIASTIEMLKEEEEAEVDVDEIIGGMDEEDIELVQTKEEEVDLEKMAGESPVIRLVNYLIFNAVKEGASDIHIEPQEKKLQVRYRIDGVLFEAMNPPHQMQAAIISRLKIMANLDISERRLPQDGRIRAMVHGRKLDLRVSTLPTAQGEKAVLRILDTRSIQVPLENLGMSEQTLGLWKQQVSEPHGIILVTGPTGSGKTTTLYASLSQMDRQKLNVSTVEDPVEYHLNGINQVQTHERIGMTFAAALRSLLRQDPDVVMVGEIRDAETAKIAIQASLTGHLVLSTLHTNDAPSAVTRLINIGVEPFLIGAALNSIVAQRLVRRICTHCKDIQPPEETVVRHLEKFGHKVSEVAVGVGCDKCRNTGYSGRLGIYELLVLNDDLRDKVAGNPSVTEFRRTCIDQGMRTLRADGFEKVVQGQTTAEEVLRVTEG